MLLLVGSLLAYGDTIGERDAADIAQRMMATFGTQSGTVGKKSAPRQAVKPRLAYAAKKVGQETAALYVYNNGDDGGFVIVAGDDRAFSPVLGYSDHGSFDYDQAPDNLRSLLTLYANQIDSARIHDLPTRRQGPRKAEEAKVVVGPLLTTTWDQGAPFNNLCPDPDGKGEHCKAGCVPIAMSQVMYYHKWPKRGHNKHGYYYRLYMADLNAIDKHKWLEVDFYQSVYDWDAMARGDGNAIARLVYDCGVASEAKYDYGGTPAYMNEVQEGLRKYFSYKGQGLRTVTLAAEGDNFDVLLKAEMDNHRPVIMAGYPVGDPKGGHAFVCDGYDDAGFFHINMGWGGQYDGYYRSSAITVQKPGIIVMGGPDYTENVSAIIGIQPNDPQAYEVDGLHYDLQDNGEARLLYGSNPGELNIPDQIEADGKTYTVTSIAPYAFYERTDITTIKLPAYLREIDDYAFYGCSATNTIYLPYRRSDDGTHLIGIQRIGDYGLAAGKYAVSSKSFGPVPATITELGEGAFYNCKNIASLQLLNMTKIPEKAFYSAYNISNLVIGGQVREIGDQAFMYSNISKIDMQPSVTKIGVEAFRLCSQIGDGVLHLPEGVVEIGQQAFLTARLKEIHLPKTVSSIGAKAMNIIPLGGIDSSGTETASIFVDPESPYFSASDGVLYDKDKTCLIVCPPSVTELSLPTTTKEVKADAFYYYYMTKSLTIPSGTKQFGDNSFALVYALTDIYNYALEPQPLPVKYARFLDRNPLTVHVVHGKKELFEAAEGWGKLTIVDDLMIVDERIYTVMTIYTKDGAVYEFQLFDKPEVTFQGRNLCVHTDKNDVSIPLSDLHHYNFEMGLNNAIKEVNSGANPDVNLNENGEITVRQLPEGTIIHVYSLDGKQVLAKTVPASGTCTFSLSVLPAGAYIVKANDITYKILKR